MRTVGRIPRPLARRIDRLAVAAHRFHRIAHHPLCGRYAAEVIRVGRGARGARVCKGCTLAATGLVVGGLLGLALRPSTAIACGTLVTIAALLLPTLRRRDRAAAAAPRARVPKTVTRLVPAALASFAVTGGIATAIATAALLGGLWWLYRRRGPDRGPCTTCPELASPAPCSGFVAIVSREQAFQRVATRWLRAAGR